MKKLTRFKIQSNILNRTLYLVYNVINEEYDIISSEEITIAHKVWFDNSDLIRMDMDMEPSFIKESR